MNKIEKVLLNSIKEMQGNILGFGNLSEKMVASIGKNDNILEFTLLSNGEPISDGSKGRSSKKLSYRKIRKRFRKKHITNIIASYDELGSYRRRFIADSLYLAEHNINLFVKNEDIDVDTIKKRYERYHQECEVISCTDGVVLKITKKKYKKNKLRDTFCLFINFLGDGINFIGDLFVS